MIKHFYNEFNSAEQAEIKKLSELYFLADMSDDYSVTLREQKEGLANFNGKFNHNFTKFVGKYYGNIEEAYFI